MSDLIVELPSYADLLTVSDGHPVVEYFLHPSRLHRAWAFRPGATATVAWIADTRRGRSLTAIGQPSEAAVLVSAVRETGTSADHLTIPAGTVPLLPFTVGDGNDWDWFWTATPPTPRPGEASVVHLDVTDSRIRSEVVGLLDIGAPGASTRPSDADATGSSATTWFGIRRYVDGAAVLVACAARSMRDPGIAHLSSITTHPDHRGRGLAGDLTTALTRRDLDNGARAMTLGMYADNDVARRVYEKIGFAVGQAFSSRSLS